MRSQRRRLFFFSLFFLTLVLTNQNCSSGSSGGGGSGAGSPSPATSPSPSPALTVQISGRVYERQASVSYSLNFDAVTSWLAGCALSLKGVNATCAADGAYTLQVPTPDYDPLSISLDGYIPIQHNLFGSGSQSVPVGLFPAPSVTPRPGFMKGMAYLDLQNTYPPPFWATVMGDPATRMNAQLASYIEIGFNHSCNGTSHTVAVSASHPTYPDWKLNTEAELAPMVATVHGAGMAFNLWLGVINVNECAGSTMFDWSASDTPFWDSWFAAYRLILLERTQVAKNLGIEWITLGHNMGYASAQAATRWSAIIAEMRALYPALKISYFGGVDLSSSPPYFESDGYNGGTPAGFASLLDSLGHAVTAVSATANPTRAAIKSAFETIQAQTATLPVPIWILPMTPSTTVGASDPTFMEPEVLTDPIALSYTTDFYQQADVYQGLFEALNGTPTGNGQIMGVLPWGYHLRNNFRDSGPDSNSNPNTGNLIVDRTSNVRGKPAESILKWWFQRL